MIVTGVPKTDPIVRSNRSNTPLPSGWECILGKKVFLWNTWFGIEGSSLRFFDKIFAWFKAHQDCALIWRPHPMTDTVTKLYSPEKYSYWKNCIRAVEGLPNAILDKETSFVPAFVYSDAMISDHGSMPQQYLLMDKPLGWFSISDPTPLTGKAFVGCEWMERTDSISAIMDFLVRIHNGGDRNAVLRSNIRKRDLPFISARNGHDCTGACRRSAWAASLWGGLPDICLQYQSYICTGGMEAYSGSEIKNSPYH